MSHNPTSETTTENEGDSEAGGTSATEADEESTESIDFDETSSALRSAPMADKAVGGDAPPEGAIATEADFMIQRDPSTGDVMPVWERIPGTDKYAQIRPLSNSEAEARLPSSGDATDLPDDELLELIQDKFERPDFGDAESLDDLVAYGIEPLIMCLNYASGFDMMRGIMSENTELVQMAQQVEGNSRPGN